MVVLPDAKNIPHAGMLVNPPCASESHSVPAFAVEIPGGLFHKYTPAGLYTHIQAMTDVPAEGEGKDLCIAADSVP
jgi:hypothetical protein